jgi:ABC-type multidrug transport system fused ATPase/permease subunit
VSAVPGPSPTHDRPRPVAEAIGRRGLLATYLVPQWPRVLLLGLLLAVTIGLQLASPQILRRFIDDATGGAPLGALALIALLFLGAALTLQVAQLGELYVAENVGLTATNRLRADLALHVLRLDPSFHAAHTPGELIERTDGDVATLGNFFARLVVHLVGNALLLLGALALLAGIDWRIGAVAGVAALIGLGLMVGLRGLVVPRHAALRQANAELFGLIEERLAGTEDVRANGGVGYVLRRLLERQRDLVWAGLRTQVAGGGTFHGATLCLHLGTVAALGVAAYLFRLGELTIGTVYATFAYAESLRRPIEAITRQLNELQQAAASVGRVRALLAERSAVVDGPGAVLPDGALAVELDRVSFAYHPGEPVLRELSFRLAPGEVLGLLGRSGSGKTTLARLLFRLYDPTAGRIRIGGVDLRRLRLDALRARVGVVTQDIQLFHASVRDNVTLFDPSVPDERVVAVLEELGLGPWLAGRPDGLATRLAPGGAGLSAGEAQLLAFARVFLADPGLVILDEASSRLDPATERLLERAVARLLSGRTAVVIAHRLATVERADRLLILDDGRVAEQGAPSALAADPGSRYSRLLRAGLDAGAEATPAGGLLA